MLLPDALRVIERGHQPPVNPDGRRSAQVAFAAYVAGLHLGAGTAPPDIARALGDEPALDVDPLEVANMLSAAVPLGALTSPSALGGHCGTARQTGWGHCWPSSSA